MLRRNESCSGQSGFSLVEMLVSMTVLAILGLILSQSVGMISDAWRKGKVQVDNRQQARSAIELIARDLQAAVIRPDLAAFVDHQKQPVFAFYTQANGTSGDRKISLVRYRVSTKGADGARRPPHLVRDDFGMAYTDSSRTMGFGKTDALEDIRDPEDPSYKFETQELAEGIFMFKWQFLSVNASHATTYNDRFSYDFDLPAAPANTRAVVVSLAVLEADALKYLQESGGEDILTAAFEETESSTSQAYADQWMEKISSGEFRDLPARVREGVQVFKRTVYLPSLGTLYQ